MKTIENIKKITLIFFIITGLAHLGSSIFIANGLHLKIAELINKSLDIPFIITGLIYGLSSLRLSLVDPKKPHKILDRIIILIIIVILLGLIAINIFLPDLK
jgi:hypothetical protein